VTSSLRKPYLSGQYQDEHLYFDPVADASPRNVEASKLSENSNQNQIKCLTRLKSVVAS